MPQPPRRALRPFPLASLLGLAAVVPAQTLASDKADYLPGETVYLAGAGFLPGELVSIVLKVENYTDTVLDYAVGGIVVDAAGDFTATWLVPNEALNTLITATAIGMTSRRAAETKFLDSHLGTYSFTVVGNTVTLDLTFSPQPGFYYDIQSVVARLETPTNPNIPMQLSRVGGGLAGTCCGPNAFGGGSTIFFQGSATFPANTPVTLRSYSVIRNLGIGASCSNSFPTVSVFGTGPGQHPATTVTTGGGVVCPTNSAPSLQLTNVDLGNLVGCLTGGTLTKDVTVADVDFAPVAADVDGDPVSIVFQGPTNFSFTGPGIVSGTVTFVATDNPVARELPGCPLTPATSTWTATVTARIVYAFDGPQAPLAPGETLLKKVGRTIPLKFTLRDCNGIEVCPANSTLFDTPVEVPDLMVTAVTMLAPGGAPVLGDPGSANDNGTKFRFDGTCGIDGKWIYNLSTAGPGWTAGVLYRADIVLNDATVRPVYFSLTK